MQTDQRLAVAVQVDEAGRDDEAGGVDLALRRAQIGADGGDGAAGDRHIADLVEAGFGVDHAAISDQQVVCHVSPLEKGFSVLGQKLSSRLV